ncbi:MAG TPA: RNA polymerase sigma factor [Ktedonobacteraceae bacterium]|jgi:RNA polymerase sigma-70 factor (ECF subfamily)|nr:RNA polymerase sigma factor [Ktedonobacteraceae bacterium]
MGYRTEDGSPLGREDIDPSLSVDALVVRAQNGNQFAFEALYTRYSDQINSYLSRMVGNDGVGCELTQEVFLKAWSALPGLRSPEFFVRWLYRIALNCARDYQKRLKHVRMVPLDTSSEGGAEFSVQGPEEGVENAELVQIALSHVSPMYRSCLILYVIEGLPQQQIAERLNIKEVCVSKYVSRGKEELRQIYHQLLRGQGRVQMKGRRGR